MNNERELVQNARGRDLVEEVVHAIADNDKEHVIRLLADDCVWEVVPWGYRARGRREVAAFLGVASKTRTYKYAGQRIQIDHWFTDGESACVELTNITSLSLFPWLRGEQRICLTLHLKDGTVDAVHEYFKAPFPVNLVIRLVPVVVRLRSRNRRD